MGSIVSFLFFDGVDAFPFFGGLDFGVTLYLVVLLSRGFALFFVFSRVLPLWLLRFRCFQPNSFRVVAWSWCWSLFS